MRPDKTEQGIVPEPWQEDRFFLLRNQINLDGTPAFDEIDARLADPNIKLFWVTGIAGSGKTGLITQMAARAASEYDVTPHMLSYDLVCAQVAEILDKDPMDLDREDHEIVDQAYNESVEKFMSTRFEDSKRHVLFAESVSLGNWNRATEAFNSWAKREKKRKKAAELEEIPFVPEAFFIGLTSDYRTGRDTARLRSEIGRVSPGDEEKVFEILARYRARYTGFPEGLTRQQAGVIVKKLFDLMGRDVHIERMRGEIRDALLVKNQGDDFRVVEKIKAIPLPNNRFIAAYLKLIYEELGLSRPLELHPDPDDIGIVIHNPYNRKHQKVTDLSFLLKP